MSRLHEQLNKAWRVRSNAVPVDPCMRFTTEGLVLGARTILLSFREMADGHVAGRERRLEALLTAAHLDRPSTPSMAHLGKAIRCWVGGDVPLAQIHLALSRLDHLRRPASDARRLFLADALLQLGLTEADLLKALASGASEASAFKGYNPDEPRVPNGNGRQSGQWTSDGGRTGSVSPTSSPPRRRVSGTVHHAKAPAKPATDRASEVSEVRSALPRPNAQARPFSADGRALAAAGAVGRAGAGTGVDLGALSEAQLARLAAFAAGLADALTISAAGAATAVLGGFGLALVPSSLATGKWVKLGGPGDVSVFQSPTVPGVSFRYTTRDGVRHTWQATPIYPGGGYPGPDGREIARTLKTAAGVSLIVSTATLLDENFAGPKLCPAPQKDRGGARGQAYENFRKVLFNPDNPTPSGMAYGFTDPANGKTVLIDDCFQKFGQPLAEYKGPGYAKHMLKNDGPWQGMYAGMVAQAARQVQASGGRPLIWFFDEKPVADRMREAFRKAKFNIQVVWAPM